MYKTYFLIIISVIFFTSKAIYAQSKIEFPNYWEGKLESNGQEINFWLKVFNENDTIKATLDIPEQGIVAKDIDEISFSCRSINFKIKDYIANYAGTIDSSCVSITGAWEQAFKKYPLNFQRLKEEPRLLRPQEPKPPFPYKSEEVSFENKKANIKLSGTLTLPEDSWNSPAVILVSGSGPQDRNSEITGHKPFLVIADYLTRNGIAVLRYDDRGTAESEGDFSTATTTDFASDAEAAFEFLKNHKGINSKQIGIIGHSEGGIIAPLLASQIKDIAFIVMLAGPGCSGEDILYQQTRLISLAEGKKERDINKNIRFLSKLYKIAKSDKSYKEAFNSLRKLYKRKTFLMSEKKRKEKLLTKASTELVIMQILSPWFREFLRIQPADYLKKVKCPVLALAGSKDLQVPPNPNITNIKNILSASGNKNVKIVVLDNLNHLFQHCTSGSVSEYAFIEETFSEEALEIIANWINQQ